MRDDADYAEFLLELDSSEVNVSDWEAEFISSNLDRDTFTEAQRPVIERMIAKYGRRIGWS